MCRRRASPAWAVKVDGLSVTGAIANAYLAVSNIGSGAHIIERVLDPLFAKTQWLQANFTTTELADPSISGDNADPDHDGIVNELEYAFGSDPKIPSPALPQPQLSADGAQFVLELSAQRSSELSYTVQASTDLKNWAPIALTSTISNSLPWLTAVLNVLSEPSLALPSRLCRDESENGSKTDQFHTFYRLRPGTCFASIW